ncbi:MAG: hypothetical protein MGG11_21460 [Trichodesmium sp. MAG_R03]|nr:hypothetical protein [Trichodesmium sp. MAG_R03]
MKNRDLMKNLRIVSCVIFSSLVTTALNATVFPSVARAGEGGIAASAHFDMDNNGNVLSVSVATAVGKQTAAAAAFRYSTSSALQSSVWAIGTGNLLTQENIGSATFKTSETAESVSSMSLAQGNSFSDRTVNILTPAGTGSVVIQSPSQ